MADSADDPLRYDYKLDPELRRLLNFTPSKKKSNRTSISSLISGFLLTEAHALDRHHLLGKTFSGKLYKWVPSNNEMSSYKKAYSRLLKAAANDQMHISRLDRRYRDTFLHLVKATALIESCWRQFKRKGSNITYMLSGAGSIGLMQINQYVWRGFYDMERIRWDAVYNAQAGVEILMRYFKNSGIPVGRKYGQPAYIPRATYAAYNGGPRARTRFLKPRNWRQKQVDKKLWTLYRGFAANGEVNLRTCLAVVPKK